MLCPAYFLHSSKCPHFESIQSFHILSSHGPCLRSTQHRSPLKTLDHVFPQESSLVFLSVVLREKLSLCYVPYDQIHVCTHTNIINTCTLLNNFSLEPYNIERLVKGGSHTYILPAHDEHFTKSYPGLS